MLCIKKKQQKNLSTSTHVTYCGCLAEENGFTFALNYSVHGLKGRFFFFFFSFPLFFAMLFYVFHIVLCFSLRMLNPSLYPPALLQHYSNGLLNAPLFVQFIASQQMFRSPPLTIKQHVL